MKFIRVPAWLFVFLCSCSLVLAEEASGSHGKKKEATAGEEEKKKKGDPGPGLLTKIWDRFHHPAEAGAGGSKPGVEREVGKSRVLLDMNLEPQPLKLSDSRILKVTLRVSNRQKKLVQLEFPTTQRIEVLVRDKVGKLVEQWSEDRTFANEPGMVSINPGEHLEYSATVSTRDLAAGQTYTVEALFPNYESLRLQRDLTPET